MTSLPSMSGYASLPFSVEKLKGYLKASQDHHIHYGLGSKDPTPKSPETFDFKAIDCSGFVREAVLVATGGKLFLPDGSYIQNDYLGKTKWDGKPFKVSKYEYCGLRDGIVRIGFILPNPIGHVVLFHNGVTYESHGGVGPDSRPWNTPALRNIAKVYVLSAEEAVQTGA